MADDDLHEAFLKANANVDFMAIQLADVIRCIMRACAASNATSQDYYAAEHLKFFIELLMRAESFRYFELIAQTIEQLKVEPDRGVIDEATIHAAQMGMRLLIERSCSDNAARGRASKRESEFLQAIRDIEEARKDVRRDRR